MKSILLKFLLLLFFVLSFSFVSSFGFTSVSDSTSDKFTLADSIRGTISPERAWWNVLRYDITVKPDYESKTISGRNNIEYEVVNGNHPLIMQIDLQEPMLIDSILFNSNNSLDFKRFGNAWYVAFPSDLKNENFEQEPADENRFFQFQYHFLDLDESSNDVQLALQLPLQL